MDPIFPRQFDDIPLKSYELTRARSAIPGGLNIRWYLEQQGREIWHRVTFDPQNGQIHRIQSYDRTQIITLNSEHTFVGYEDDVNEINIVKAPGNIVLRCPIPNGLVEAQDGDEYTFHEVVNYLWSILIMELDIYDIALRPGDGIFFAITYDHADNSYNIIYIGGE